MPVTSNTFFSSLALLAASAAVACAQQPGVLTIPDPPKLVVKRTENPSYSLKVSIKPGYHANSNKPSEDYLIPLKLTWEPGALEVEEVIYPKPKHEQFSFSEKPLSIFDGEFEIVTKFKRSANPPLGPGFLAGKLRYQACNDKMCLPPKSIEVKLPVLMQ